MPLGFLVAGWFRLVTENLLAPWRNGSRAPLKTECPWDV